jgi:hypothetical protein
MNGDGGVTLHVPFTVASQLAQHWCGMAGTPDTAVWGAMVLMPSQSLSMEHILRSPTPIWLQHLDFEIAESENLARGPHASAA